MRAPCDRSGRSAWLKVVPGLTPDSIPQKYAQTVTSTWTTPIRCSFWGMKGVSTRPGPIADARGLLLRSTFKQPVADLLRYKALRPLPCLVIVAAELEVLSEHDALGCCIDGSNPHNLHQRA